MKMQKIDVSDEYLDTLCRWIDEFASDADSLTIPQFLSQKGIGYHYFKYFIYRSPKVRNAYEVMKSALCDRWVRKAMSDKNMPQHQAKVLMRYLSVYDSHARDLDEESKKAIAEVEKIAELNFTSENYASSKLEGVYKGFYEKNTNKRRSKAKA